MSVVQCVGHHVFVCLCQALEYHQHSNLCVCVSILYDIIFYPCQVGQQKYFLNFKCLKRNINESVQGCNEAIEILDLVLSKTPQVVDWHPRDAVLAG